MKTRQVSEIAIIIALTAVFEIIFSNLGITLFPNGGSISLAVLPLMILTVRYGFVSGLIAASIFGIFQFILPYPVYFLTPLQYVFDYILPYVAIPFVVLFGKKSTQLVVGGIIVFGLKYLSHVIAGVVYWGEYAPEGFSAWTWSLWYNATYSVPSVILSVVVLYLISTRYPQLLAANADQ